MSCSAPCLEPTFCSALLPAPPQSTGCVWERAPSRGWRPTRCALCSPWPPPPTPAARAPLVPRAASAAAATAAAAASCRAPTSQPAHCTCTALSPQVVGRKLEEVHRHRPLPLPPAVPDALRSLVWACTHPDPEERCVQWRGPPVARRAVLPCGRSGLLTRRSPAAPPSPRPAQPHRRRGCCQPDGGDRPRGRGKQQRRAQPLSTAWP